MTTYVNFITRDQVFNMSITGLMPHTVHYLYVETKLQPASVCKPYGKKLGDPIITDENGQVQFDYYYSSGLAAGDTLLSTAQQQAASIAGTKSLVVGNQSVATLPTDYLKTFLSSATSFIVVTVTV